MFLDLSSNEAALARDRAKFISNPHLERKEKQAYQNYRAFRSYRAHVYWHRVWIDLLAKLRRQGNKFTCWSDYGREEYYSYKPKGKPQP